MLPMLPARPAVLRLAVLLAAIGVSACESGPPPLPADAPVVSSDAPGAGAPGTAAPSGPLPAVVPAARLGEALPAAVGGVARAALVAEQDSAMGLSVSRAEATYGTGADAVTLLVLDVGSAEGARLMGLVPGDDTLDGLPVTRTDTATGASVRVHVGERYVVEARGPDAAALDAYVRAVNLGPLPGAE